MNTTRTRKSPPIASDIAAAKPAGSRKKVGAPPKSGAVKPTRKTAKSAVTEAMQASASTRAAKAPAKVRAASAVAAAAKPAKRVPKRSGAPAAVAAAAANSTVRKNSKPKAAAAVTVVAAAPQPKTARKSAKAKPSTPTVDVLVRDAVIARLDSMKANDLKVIDVRGKTSITDCLVIASGTSTRHVRSMGDEVIVTAKKFGLPPLGVEGEKDAEWMLVDLGDTVVHVMLPRAREFYGLERLWTLAEESRAASAAALASV